MLKKYSEQIQRFGRSLLLPISVMAPVGMVLGISDCSLSVFSNTSHQSNLSGLKNHCRRYL
ncbi:MAG: PTS system glucose-like IIB component [Erysipelotrichaceae bacterium]|nr:MAG: PTS system glucose-like IIB component [Erysipelotrichaceae bacterium]